MLLELISLNSDLQSKLSGYKPDSSWSAKRSTTQQMVKSNIEKQFQFELANAIEDFTIDNFEKQKLDLRKEQLREIYKNNGPIESFVTNPHILV